MSTVGDYQLAAGAAGFTLGFGFLTVWEAIKQTRANKSPLRSPYIYMVWGEIVANLWIGIIGWLILDGVLGPNVIVLFLTLLPYVFEIQLLMQIIINRITIIAENKKFARRLKWGTAIVITMINIAVFCIWIPAHKVPAGPVIFIHINKYWDRTSKILICLVDAGLNWYFLRTVRVRLVNYYGLTKYAPLVSFNAKLMVVSVSMDVMLIGLMSLPNQLVYIQFHPVAYMVKLNIEMSMASLIARLARGQANNDVRFASDTHSHQRSRRMTADLDRKDINLKVLGRRSDEVPVAYETATEIRSENSPFEHGMKDPSRGISVKSSKDIVCRTDMHVIVDDKNEDSGSDLCESAYSVAAGGQVVGDVEDRPLPPMSPAAQRITKQRQDRWLRM